MTPETNPDYESLRRVLSAALHQAAAGKGAERHANGQPFEGQRMQTISDLLDSPAGMAFQCQKKLLEGLQLPTLDRQERELLGAINYIAGIVIWLRRRGAEVDRDEPQKVAIESPTGTLGEVLVVGAGPAGSACATHLARAGREVWLVDQHDFPPGTLGGVLVRQVPGGSCYGCLFDKGRDYPHACCNPGVQRLAGFEPCNPSKSIFVEVGE